MNLLEARKSGRRYKRAHWEHYHTFEDSLQRYYTADIDAEDYILEPEPKKKIKLYAYVYLSAYPRALIFSNAADNLCFLHGERAIRLPGLDQEIEE